jgi:prepilin-type N-terminal cleavage/methylation domain-containing protein
MRGARGFTLLEVMISLAIVGGLLVTLVHTLNYQLGVVERQEVITTATLLAKGKLVETENTRSVGKGSFKDPYVGYTYETAIKDSPYFGISEIIVKVRSEKEEVTLNEFVF